MNSNNLSLFFGFVRVRIFLPLISMFVLLSSCNTSKRFENSIIEAIKYDAVVYVVVPAIDSSGVSNEIAIDSRLLFSYYYDLDSNITEAVYLQRLKDIFSGSNMYRVEENLLHHNVKPFLFRKQDCDVRGSLKQVVSNYFREDSFFKSNIDSKTYNCIVSYLFQRRILLIQSDYSGYFYIENSKRIKKILKRVNKEK